jgi:hypothetical protein
MGWLPLMVIKTVKGFEPEWDFAVLLIMILGLGNCRPGTANIFAVGLKEYQNCYNTTECQFFIYIREALKAEEMVLF